MVMLAFGDVILAKGDVTSGASVVILEGFMVTLALGDVILTCGELVLGALVVILALGGDILG